MLSDEVEVEELAAEAEDICERQTINYSEQTNWASETKRNNKL